MLLRVGEAVQLKSGGPTMTVDKVDGDLVTCIWMDADEQFNHEEFPLFMLVKLSEQIQEPRAQDPDLP